MPLYRRACQECGTEFETRRYDARFCPAPARCRASFNDRRQARGAELYDFMMLKGEGHDVDEQINDLLKAYRDSDATLRGGRRSHQQLRQARMGVKHVYDARGDMR